MRIMLKWFHKKFLIFCVSIALLIGIRGGEYLIDHMFGDKDGKITASFLASGLGITYSLLIIFIAFIVMTSLIIRMYHSFQLTFLKNKYIWIDLGISALIVSGLAMMGGLPFYHPDFIDGRAYHVLTSGGNPNFFKYPGLVIYLNAFIYYCSKLLPVKLSNYLLVGHIITVMFSTVAVIFTYLLTYILIRDRVFSFISALFLSTSLLWVVDSHFITVDVPLAALCLLTVYFTCLYTSKYIPLNIPQLTILGTLIGLTTSAKYNGAFVSIAVVGATFVCYKNRKQWFIHLLLMAFIAILIFFIINPFALIESKQFREDLLFELSHAKRGHWGYSTNQGWVFHLSNTLYFAVGIPILVLVPIGGYWLSVNNKIRGSNKLALVLFPVIFYLLTGSSKLAFQRYMLPILPFVSIYASLGMYAFHEFLYKKTNQKFIKKAILTCAIIILLPNIYNIFQHNLLLSSDTRTDLKAILQGTQFKILNTTVYAGGSIEWLFSPIKTVLDWRNVSIDVGVFDSFSHDRYIYDYDYNERHVKEFQSLLQSFRDGVVVEISPFIAPKQNIPFSPKSLYSPYLPDLKFREKAGPFIELYCKDEFLSNMIIRTCNELNIKYQYLPAKSGYYYQQFTEIESKENSES